MISHRVPDGFVPEPGQCTLNASELEGWDGARYAEGFASGPGEEPTPHAWLVMPDGEIVDPTWADAGAAFDYREDTAAWRRD